jgi:hypothetical protein
MPRHAALAVLAVSVTLAAAAPVRHAGEWEVTVGNAPPRLVCFSKDETFDQTSLTRAIGAAPGRSCTITKLETVGDVTSFATQCTFNGTTIASAGTVTQTGPDAFTAKVHLDGGPMNLPDGRTYTMPARDIVNVSRRVGPCKPGDHQMPNN